MTTETDTLIDITPAAMETVLGILAEEDEPDTLGLRIEITGTKGVDYIYDLSFDELANMVDGDVVTQVSDLQVIVPEVASAVMISPTKTFDQSPAEWVGAAVLIAYGILAGLVGTWVLRRRDVA